MRMTVTTTMTMTVADTYGSPDRHKSKCSALTASSNSHTKYSVVNIITVTVFADGETETD